MPTGPVARELIGDAAAARAALQDHCNASSRATSLHLAPRVFSQCPTISRYSSWSKGLERDPQAETLGKRDLLLHRLAGMDLVADVLGLEVLRMYSGIRWRRFEVA